MKSINKNLKSLKSSGSLGANQDKKIKIVGSRPGILHDVCKVHETIVDACLSFTHLLFAIGTPTTFFFTIHNCLATNEFTVKRNC